MVAEREAAHFLRLYKTEFTNFLDEYQRWATAPVVHLIMCGRVLVA